MTVPSSSMPRTSQLLVQQRLEEIDSLVKDGQKTEEEVAEERKELEKRAGRRWRLNLWLLGILLAAASISAVLRALLEESGLRWLFIIRPLPAQVGDIASVLAPFLALAVAIERLLEIVFDWYEQSVQAVSNVVAAAREPINLVEKELTEAYKAAEEAAKHTGVAADEASLKALDLAEHRLAKAEKRLLSWVKAPEYVAWKRAVTIRGALLVGLLFAVLGDLGMFHTVGVPAPRIFDMLATGLVIGTGPGPMHSVIGILQGGKDALGKLAELAEGRAVRDALAALNSDTGG